MAWATVSEVADITGQQVSVSELARADAVVTLYSGRTADDQDNIRKPDLYWLKHATAWQSVWQEAQVSFETRSSVGSVDQDDVRVSFDHEWQAVLSPLAARALRNLSWKRSRRITRGRTAGYRDFVLESSDPYLRWSR